MLNNFVYRLISVLLILLMMVIAGCATTGPAKSPQTITPPPQEIAASNQEDEELYKNANATISELWQEEGQHAFLHHLSALFGYREIIFYDKRMLKF